MKRSVMAWVALLVTVCIAITLFSFTVSADSESWIILDYRTSQDGTTWSGRKELQLTSDTYIQFPDDQYFKVDRIRVLNTSNKPSDLYIQFALAIHPYKWTNATSTAGWLGQSSEFSNTNSNVTGYFRYRGAYGYYASPAESFGQGLAMMFVGQYHIDDVQDTSFTLTPTSSNPVGVGFTYSSSGYHGLAISVHDVNIVFVGNDSQLYDINGNLADIETLIQNFYNLESNFDSWFQNTFYTFLTNWQADWLDFHDSWDSDFIPKFTGIWTYMCNSVYGIYTISSFGNALNRATLTNPLSAFNTSLSNILRSVYVPAQNLYSYDSVTYDSDGIGSVTTSTNKNWYESVLGQLKGSSAIEQHHMEMENEALEEGASQAYQDYLGEASTNYGFLSDFTGIGILRGLYDKSESNYSILSILGMWFSTQNSNAINGTSEDRSAPEVEDFVSQNSDLDWFGEH